MISFARIQCVVKSPLTESENNQIAHYHCALISQQLEIVFLEYAILRDCSHFIIEHTMEYWITSVYNITYYTISTDLGSVCKVLCQTKKKFVNIFGMDKSKT